MTAVIAEGLEGGPPATPHAGDFRPPPELWAELEASVDRAGGDPSRFWVDDSKAILRGGKGRDRLESTCLALLEAVFGSLPANHDGLLGRLGCGTIHEVELGRWIDAGCPGATWPRAGVCETLRPRLMGRPLAPPSGRWRFSAVRTVVLGPERFNGLLDHHGSKAAVHFGAFRVLLEEAWRIAADGRPTALDCDKHGGRHYYLEPLSRAFPEAWIDRGEEGPELSEYTVRGDGRLLRLRLRPRADAGNGLVALASIVSKTVREVWMDAFNAYWTARVAGLRPTAGYPVDAARFRAAIEPLARELGHPPEAWWRRK
ncbi:hypothetical protein [Aquisphaera giovannonii]|nr:hypothetical protein [Aquisphaera giovannonii]